jgi:hypothetical protein
MAAIDEYKKFAASMPESEREYRTIELYHPDFSSTLRFVASSVDEGLTLESDAPRDASVKVNFVGINMKVIEPQESGEIEQILTVSIGGVGGEVNNIIDELTEAGRLTPIDLIYRKFYSGDGGAEPVIVVKLSVADVSMKGYEQVTFTAEDIDFATKRAGELYLIERFSGLRSL